MRKKFLSVILAFCMLLAIMPTSIPALATEDYTLHFDATDGTFHKSYHPSVMVDAVPVDMTSAGAEATGTEGNWTITFTDFSFETSAYISLMVHDDVTIKLVGSNTLVGSGGGISVDGDLAIEGDGTLTAVAVGTSDTHAIGAMNLVISDNATVIATADGPTNNYGISAMGITVRDNATLTVNSGDSAADWGDSIGIRARNLTTSDSATVTATSGHAFYSYGIYVDDDLVVRNYATVTAMSNEDNPSKCSCGMSIRGTLMPTIYGGTVTAIGRTRAIEPEGYIIPSGYKYWTGETMAGEDSGELTGDGVSTSISDSHKYVKIEYGVPDVLAPTPQNAGAITASNISTNSLTLNWTKAEDDASAQTALKYYVYRKVNSDFTYIAGLPADGVLLNSSALIDIGTYRVSGLTPNTVYYFAVIVEDEAGNKATYVAQRVTTDTESVASNDSTINYTTASGEREGTSGYKDIAITLTLNSNTLNSIKNANAVLTRGTDYTISGNTIIIKGSYLDTLADGNHIITFDMSGGVDPVLTITLVIKNTPPPTWNNTLIDVSASDWFYADAQYVYENGLFKGTSDTTFEPEASMTRGMMVTVLGRLAGIDFSNYSGASYDDVAISAYYAPYIKWASANGIVNGVGDNKFNPDDTISRQDLATIIHRYAQIMDDQLPVADEKRDFNDSNLISDYAANAVEAIQRAGIIEGRPGNIYDPVGKATRAEVAAMIHRFAKAVEIE